MTEESAPVDSPLKSPHDPSDDHIFAFDISNWIDPPVYVTNLPETSPDSNIRVMAEQEYRKSTTATCGTVMLRLDATLLMDSLSIQLWTRE